MLRENPLLQTVEMINTYTIGRRKTDSFQAQLWTHMLQHDGLKSISLHNTNCVPQKQSHCGNPTRSDKLRELSITFCDLNLASITWLRVHFASHHSLERLVLSDNGMRDDSIEMLCKMLRENNSVTYLDISNNNFGDAAMRYICCMLAEGADKTCKLSKLVLESNNLGDAGAILLAETLSASQQLKMLNVKDNNIGRRGIVALINTLWHNTGLDTLSLAFNYTDTSTEMLLQGALRANTTLRSLDVSMQQSDIISNWANDTVPYDNSNTQLDVVGWRAYQRMRDRQDTSTVGCQNVSMSHQFCRMRTIVIRREPVGPWHRPEHGNRAPGPEQQRALCIVEIAGQYSCFGRRILDSDFAQQNAAGAQTPGKQARHREHVARCHLSRRQHNTPATGYCQQQHWRNGRVGSLACAREK
jgi:hypothetical protein